MAIYVVNVIIDQGVIFSKRLTWLQLMTRLLDLTGYTASYWFESTLSSKLFYDFTVTFTDRVNGQIKLALTDTITKRIKAGRYIYDFDLTDSNLEKTKILEGSALVRESAFGSN